MGKTIRKPDDWHTFESLCKKLWGEVWDIPSKIKKNGRRGQPQSGVDIYGVPKDQNDYSGIQCKGKDDYTHAKLTKKEIDTEIENAKSFKPKLATFIFATTMNKDSVIEEYVRLKDVESRKDGLFEILLFCWEDIADLIEENQNTYNYWVVERKHKTKFHFSAYFDNWENKITIHPKFVRKIKRYRLKPKPIKNDLPMGVVGPMDLINWNTKLFPQFDNSKISVIGPPMAQINEALCSFKVIMENDGASVIEDWEFSIELLGEFKELTDLVGIGPFVRLDIIGLNAKRTFIKDNWVRYLPKDYHPLIQDNNRLFELYIIPKPETYTIPIKWELLARDYRTSGELALHVEPEFDDIISITEVTSKEDLQEDQVISIVEKKSSL